MVRDSGRTQGRRSDGGLSTIARRPARRFLCSRDTACCTKDDVTLRYRCVGIVRAAEAISRELARGRVTEATASADLTSLIQHWLFIGHETPPFSSKSTRLLDCVSALHDSLEYPGGYDAFQHRAHPLVETTDRVANTHPSLHHKTCDKIRD